MPRGIRGSYSGRRKYSQIKVQNVECSEEHQTWVNMWGRAKEIRLFKLKMSWCGMELHGNNNTEEETV